MALSPPAPTAGIVGCLRALDKQKQGTISRDDLESLLCVYLNFSKSDLTELLELSPALQHDATVRYEELINWLFNIPSLKAPDQVQCEDLAIASANTNSSGSMTSAWLATETYYQCTSNVMSKRWSIVSSHWIIFRKTSGFVPSGHGQGPVFVAGKITHRDLAAQVQRMFAEGVRIAGFGPGPVWKQVEAQNQQLFFPDKDVVMKRKGTFWESTFKGNDDSEGELVVVQIGYHQKTPDQMQAAPDGKKFKYVGNGFYWQVKLADFLGNNRWDDETVWFSDIPP